VIAPAAGGGLHVAGLHVEEVGFDFGFARSLCHQPDGRGGLLRRLGHHHGDVLAVAVDLARLQRRCGRRHQVRLRAMQLRRVLMREHGEHGRHGFRGTGADAADHSGVSGLRKREASTRFGKLKSRGSAPQ
jgi:hypothetical protein